MTLIERLREHAAHQIGDSFRTCREAASEVERLTAERDTWEKRARDYGWPDCGELAQMTDERDALRAALDKIAERTSSDDPCRPLVQIARDTLAAIDEARKA